SNQLSRPDDQGIHLAPGPRHPDQLVAADEPEQNSIAFLKVSVLEPRPEQERLAGPVLRFCFLRLRFELSARLEVRGNAVTRRPNLSARRGAQRSESHHHEPGDGASDGTRAD